MQFVDNIKIYLFTLINKNLPLSKALSFLHLMCCSFTMQSHVHFFALFYLVSANPSSTQLENILQKRDGCGR